MGGVGLSGEGRKGWLWDGGGGIERGLDYANGQKQVNLW